MTYNPRPEPYTLVPLLSELEGDHHKKWKEIRKKKKKVKLLTFEDNEDNEWKEKGQGNKLYKRHQRYSLLNSG